MYYDFLLPENAHALEALLSSNRWEKVRGKIIDVRVVNVHNNIRFVLRDGVKILQQEYEVKALFNSLLYFHGQLTNYDSYFFWLDVPMGTEDV